MPDLLDEVERLRAENAALMTELIDADRYVGGAETDVETLRARVAELEEQDNRVQAMADRLAEQAAEHLLRARAAERRVAELVAVLRSVEWNGAVVLTVAGCPPNVVAVCPICQNPKKSQRHYSDCALDAALRKADD